MRRRFAIPALLMLLPGFAPAEEPSVAAEEIAVLIERCRNGDDQDEATAAVERFAGKLVGGPRYRESGENESAGFPRPNRDWLLTEIGRGIRERAAALDGGLPPVARFSQPLRLGPLFDGMLPLWHEKDPAAMMKPLLPLVNDEWLALAERCGSYGFPHTVRLLRGELNGLLLTYQAEQSESGLLLVGRAARPYPERLGDIRLEQHAAATLAWFLAGAFNEMQRTPDENFEWFAAAGGWLAARPELLDELRPLLRAKWRSEWYAAVARFRNADQRAVAVAEIMNLSLFPPHDEKFRIHRLRFAGMLLTRTAGADEEVAAAFRSLPTVDLAEMIGLAWPRHGTERRDDHALWRCALLLGELVKREDRPAALGRTLRFDADDLLEIAARWDREGHSGWAGQLRQSAKSLPQ
jgi:hypothetical protein